MGAHGGALEFDGGGGGAHDDAPSGSPMLLHLLERAISALFLNLSLAENHGSKLAENTDFSIVHKNINVNEI